MYSIPLKKSYYEITGKLLENSSQMNSFNIFQDEDSNKYMNIFRCFNIDISINAYNMHPLDYEDTWDLLSYNYYKTCSFWWTIPLINKIENPFEMPAAGTNIKILKSELLYELLKQATLISEE